MNTPVQQTAHAFVMIYKALPEEVQAEVRRLMRELDRMEFEGTDAWQHLSQASFAEEWDKPENAHWNAYLATPNPMGSNELTEELSTDAKAKEQIARIQQMENIIAPLRVPLPVDYQFDQEESNER